MRPLLAVDGIGAAIFAQELILSCFGSLLLLLVAAVGFFGRSRFATTAAVLLAFAAACCCVPWKVLAPYESDGPDVRRWVGSARTVAVMWALGAVATMAAWVRVFVLATETDHPGATMPVPPAVPAASTQSDLPATWQEWFVWLLALGIAILVFLALMR